VSQVSHALKWRQNGVEMALQSGRMKLKQSQPAHLALKIALAWHLVEFPPDETAENPREEIVISTAL